MKFIKLLALTVTCFALQADVMDTTGTDLRTKIRSGIADRIESRAPEAAEKIRTGQPLIENPELRSDIQDAVRDRLREKVQNGEPLIKNDKLRSDLKTAIGDRLANDGSLRTRLERARDAFFGRGDELAEKKVA